MSKGPRVPGACPLPSRSFQRFWMNIRWRDCGFGVLLAVLLASFASLAWAQSDVVSEINVKGTGAFPPTRSERAFLRKRETFTTLRPWNETSTLCGTRATSRTSSSRAKKRQRDGGSSCR